MPTLALKLNSDAITELQTKFAQQGCQSDEEIGCKVNKKISENVNMLNGALIRDNIIYLPNSFDSIEQLKPFNFEDLAIDKNIVIDKTIIANYFGVPASIIGIKEYNDKEYDNFINTTIKYYCHLIEQELNNKLFKSDNYKLEFNIYQLYSSYYSNNLVDAVTKLAGKPLFTINELRGMMGFDRLENKQCDEIIALENYIPLDAIGKQKKINE
jgi:HK97 family phage portal protein